MTGLPALRGERRGTEKGEDSAAYTVERQEENGRVFSAADGWARLMASWLHRVERTRAAKGVADQWDLCGRRPSLAFERCA